MTELTLKTTLDELNASMLEKLKSFFMGDAIVHVRISTIPDETTFLLSTQANRASLERSIAQFQQGEFIVKAEEELEE